MRKKNSEIYLRELEKDFKELLSPLKIGEFSLGYGGYSSDVEYGDEIVYFPPFYEGYRFYHFNEMDVVIMLQLCGYEIVKFMPSGRSFYAKLAYSNERIYLFTMPDNFVIRFKVEDSEKKKDENKNIENETKNEEEIEEIEIEIDGFSTIAFYRLSGSDEFRVLKLPEINGIFIDHLLKYLSRWYSADYKRYIF